MKSEKFLASDMRQAMALVRKSLGNDAVIIASRRVGDQTEITAASGSAVAAMAAPEPARPPHSEMSPVIRSIQEELGRLRTLFEGELAQLSWREMGRLQPNRVALITRFEQGGVDQELAAALVDQCLPCADLEQGWSKALGLLGRNLKPWEWSLLDEGGVVALLGSTGVGKTTTAAKIAAQFALRHGRKQVALVSTDRFKVGGQEQLVSFGSALGIPVQIATNAEEMKCTLESLSERRLVVIDTAGMGQRDLALAEQFKALDIDVPIRPLLVLPATARAGVIEETLKGFAPMHCHAAILTKLDEADALGPLLSCVVRHALPLAFVSKGQKVPDDLQLPRPKDLLSDIVRHYRLALRKPLPATTQPLRQLAV